MKYVLYVGTKGLSKDQANQHLIKAKNWCNDCNNSEEDTLFVIPDNTTTKNEILSLTSNDYNDPKNLRERLLLSLSNPNFTIEKNIDRAQKAYKYITEGV